MADVTSFVRDGSDYTGRQKLDMVWRLSIPAILAQLTSIMMQYIDAAMVGSLGAEASASIGVVSTSTWLLGGVCSAASVGFSVQAAHEIGGGNQARARQIFANGIAAVLAFAILLAAGAALISRHLPVWLGADASICRDASNYFLVYACALPAMQINYLAGGMLQCSGDMRTPSILNAMLCVLDVIFNWLFIRFFGVLGAAMGTALAELVIGGIMLVMAAVRSPVLHFRKGELWKIDNRVMTKAVRIAAPAGFEHIAICGAMIASTKIIAPLGTVAIAANSFAITAESLCYMPGYGIAAAATTLVGQSIGAGKKKLAVSVTSISLLLGCAVMAATGILMYFLCPAVFAMLTPDLQVRQLGVQVLRIELFAEPLFAASIVASGALRGAGDTLIPSILNLISIWGVRVTLSILLVGSWGLAGAWIAMAVELCVRGILLMVRVKRGKWLDSYNKGEKEIIDEI